MKQHGISTILFDIGSKEKTIEAQRNTELTAFFDYNSDHTEYLEVLGKVLNYNNVFPPRENINFFFWTLYGMKHILCDIYIL